MGTNIPQRRINEPRRHEVTKERNEAKDMKIGLHEGNKYFVFLVSLSLKKGSVKNSMKEK